MERHELGFIGLMEADGTRYEVLVIPFKGYLGLGYISMSNGYLVVDGGEKTAYTFKNPPVWDYVWEKLIRGYRQGLGETDAQNTAHLIAHVIGAAQDEAAQEQAKQEAREQEARKQYEEHVIYNFGEARLEEDDEEAEDVDKSGNVIYPLCLKACPMGYTEAQIREGLCTEICEDVQEEAEDE